MNIDSEITQLTQKWYALVGQDHHKDRDCHFYIEKRWSYGLPPDYHVIHEGYVWGEDIHKGFRTSADAHRFLIDKLKEMIAAETARAYGG